jgi:hypothetical protein
LWNVWMCSLSKRVEGKTKGMVARRQERGKQGVVEEWDSSAGYAGA